MLSEMDGYNDSVVEKRNNLYGIHTEIYKKKIEKKTQMK
jgi:hypothetical protein